MTKKIQLAHKNTRHRAMQKLSGINYNGND